MDMLIEQTDASCFEDIKHFGITVFRNKIEAQHIEQMKHEIAIIKSMVMARIKDMERPLSTYSDIAERHLGRLDYRCGFTADIFETVGKPIAEIISYLSPPITFRHYWEAIPSMAGSGPTNMHRDVYPILNTTQGVNLSGYDLDLPPYYFTVLIPLVEITPENGPTVFIKSSHLKPIVNEDQEEIYVPLLSPGDFLIFDGRTLHMGLANQTQQERLVAYITFVANWYHDQTFTINNYLFPELVTGR